MAKVVAENFDPNVCMGQRLDLDGPCPHMVRTEESTGRPVVDRLARAERKALEVVNLAGDDGPGDFKCDMCGCPLTNLQLTNRAPEGCPRLRKHK